VAHRCSPARGCHIGRVQHQLPVRLLQRPARQRLDDESCQQEAGVGVGAGRAWGRGRRLAGRRQVDQIRRGEPPPTAAVSHRVQDRGLGEEVWESAGVVQQLAEGDGGSVGASRAVVEPVDEVAGEVAAGRILESAAALIGQHQQGGGGHHLGDAGDPEGHLGIQAATVVGVGGRSRGPAFGLVGGFDLQQAPVDPWEQPAGGGLGHHPIEGRRPAPAVSSRVAHGVLQGVVPRERRGEA
jgi:hypothetical protein